MLQACCVLKRILRVHHFLLFRFQALVNHHHQLIQPENHDLDETVVSTPHIPSLLFAFSLIPLFLLLKICNQICGFSGKYFSPACFYLPVPVSFTSSEVKNTGIARDLCFLAIDETFDEPNSRQAIYTAASFSVSPNSVSFRYS